MMQGKLHEANLYTSQAYKKNSITSYFIASSPEPVLRSTDF